MAVVFFILRLIGWILLAVLLLLVAALFIPLGISLEYRPTAPCVKAFYGPLHFTLWPRKAAAQAAHTTSTSAPRKATKSAPDKSTPDATAVSAPKSASAKADVPASSSDAAPPPPAKDSAPASSRLPFGVSDHIDAALQLLSEDPMAFAKCMLEHTGWFGKHLLRSIRIRHLYVFWTVTAEEASATAQLYGAELALLNNLMAFIQQYVSLQSDRLWLEPDFTGQRAGERRISCTIHSFAAVLLWVILRLLHRLWKDPQLQPTASNS